MINRTKGRMRLCCSLIGLLLIFIWGNSLLPGSVSGAISNGVKDLLTKFLPFLFRGPAGESSGGLIRKLAHFTEFAALGITFSWLYGMLCDIRIKQIALALSSGALTACIDETIQRFVPDRHGCLPDVGIDTAGVITGILLFTAVYLLNQNHQKHLEETK